MTGQEDLEHRVLATLGHPCPVCSGAVRLLLAHPHERHAFDFAVAALGLSDRHALERRMRGDGFPTLNLLQDWLRLLILLDTWEGARWRPQDEVDALVGEPSVASRIASRVTGITWPEVRRQGLDAWLTRFAEEIGAHIRCKRN